MDLLRLSLYARYDYILIGFYEQDRIDWIECPLCYYQYVDDNFLAFFRVMWYLGFSVDSFHHYRLHVKKKTTHCCLFGLSFYTGLTTFPWLYTRRNSFFFPKQEKVNRIKTFVYRILIIYSKTKLNSEIEFVREILLENRYLLDLMPSSIRTRIARFNNLELYCREKCPL